MSTEVRAKGDAPNRRIGAIKGMTFLRTSLKTTANPAMRGRVLHCLMITPPWRSRPAEIAHLDRRGACKALDWAGNLRHGFTRRMLKFTG